MGVVLPYSCSNWEIVQGDNRQKLIIKDEETGHVYGAAGAGKYPTQMIRGRFAVSFFTQFAVGILFRLPYKIIHFLSGDFIARGAEMGQREWEHIRFRNHQNNIKEKPYLAPRIARSVLTELVKDIIKIVTYPLALIVLQFITLIGIFDPLDGRKWYAYIEDLYAMGDEEYFGCLFVTNFHMPCNQPQEVWERRNLFIGTHSYHPESPLSQILSIKKLIQKDAPYFENKKDDFLKLLNEAKEQPGYKNENCYHSYDRFSQASLSIAKKLIVDFINDPYQTRPEIVYAKFYHIIRSRNIEAYKTYWKLLDVAYLIDDHKEYFGKERFGQLILIVNKIRDKQFAFLKEKIDINRDEDLRTFSYLESVFAIIKTHMDNHPNPDSVAILMETILKASTAFESGAMHELHLE